MTPRAEIKHLRLHRKGLAVLAGLGLILAACSTAGTSNNNSSSHSKVRYGGTLNVAYAEDASTLDPQVCYDSVCWDAMQMLFDRLYDYYRNTTRLIPQAASAMPKVQAGGRVYVIPIRHGMRFSNGQPVTAQDFVYSFDRILNPKTQSPVQGFWSGVVGAQSYMKHPVGNVSGIKAINASTLQISLQRPDSAFPYVLAMPQASVIPAGSASAPGFAHHPIGSGPYTLKAWNAGTSMIFVRNPHYWKYPIPYTSEVYFHIGPSPQVQLLQLEKGQIQLMGDQIPSSMYLQLTGNPQMKSLIVPRLGLSTYYLTFEVHMKPFNNVLVRRAVAMAINKPFLLRLVHNQGTVANGIIPPDVLGYVASGEAPSVYNPSQAKALLAKAGYPHGFTTQLYSWNTDPWTTLDAQIQQNLAKIGVKVQIHAIAETAFFGLTSTPNRTPMTLSFWIADFPTASDFFDALLSCAAAVKGGENASFYCNPKVDSLVNRALASTTPSQAVADYQQAQKIMMAGQPIVPLYHANFTNVHAANLGGFFSQPIWGASLPFYWLTTGSAQPPARG